MMETASGRGLCIAAAGLERDLGEVASLLRMARTQLVRIREEARALSGTGTYLRALGARLESEADGLDRHAKETLQNIVGPREEPKSSIDPELASKVAGARSGVEPVATRQAVGTPS